MTAVGIALPGGLALPARSALDLLDAAADAGAAPLVATEVNGLDAVALLAALAVRRPGTDLGAGVLPLGSRSVPGLAMAAATVAATAGAVFHLGVGVSTPQVVGGWHGGEHDATVDGTRDRLRSLRAILRGDRRGSFALAVDPAPGSVQVLLGAMGPRMVELGFSEADGVIVNHTPPDALVDPVEGRTLWSYVWLRAAPDAGRRIRREIVSYACAPPYARHFTSLGFGDDVEAVAKLRAEGRLREAPDALSDAIVDALYVTPAALASRVAAVRERGALPVVLPVTGDDPARDIVSTIDALRGLSEVTAHG
ncbi:LLM class flavin-dependent oxidoreductase [Nitriliruptor alkaliphilus]|uniref:LLM class flavin-dependent oxidoreductase n=1 Tax=Nitriliruptor alkaliphilus TaxID=427918 RepID=UPI0006978984|nr:LLM class flavin-dependent oxidoreductase [Nitriliruptor alkaliphilus]